MLRCKHICGRVEGGTGPDGPPLTPQELLRFGIVQLEAQFKKKKKSEEMKDRREKEKNGIHPSKASAD